MQRTAVAEEVPRFSFEATRERRRRYRGNSMIKQSVPNQWTTEVEGTHSVLLRIRPKLELLRS